MTKIQGNQGGSSFMSPSHNRERPTSILVTAANLLQGLSPSKLGLLLAIYDDDLHTQKELSDLIGRTQSTISTYLQSLSTLSPPLAAKGKHYIATNTGEKVLSLVNDISRRCDLELRSVDWTDEEERETVDALLTPLHDSQIMRPIFILDSLYDRSDIDGPIGSPQPVRFTDIVYDVEQRQDEIEKSTTTEEIRRTVKNRFDDTDAVQFEDGSVTLTYKGHQHAWLLNELVQYLKDIDDVGTSDNKMTEIVHPEPTTEQLDSFTTATSRGTKSSPNTSQDINTEILQSDAPSISRQDDVHQASIVPVYVLQRQQDSSPVLPLTEKISIKDLTIRANQLAEEYDEEMELVLRWMVQTESGLYPLSSTKSSNLSGIKLHDK